MRDRTFAALLVLLMLPMIVLPLLDVEDTDEYGSICFPAAGLRTTIYHTYHGDGCGCCGALWNGGVVSVKVDMGTVRLYDMADLRTIDGEHLVLECVEIVECIRVGRCLVSVRGIIRTQGDVLVCIRTRWPLLRVLRLSRL